MTNQQPHIVDPNTEAYHAVWVSSRSRAVQALAAETRQIVAKVESAGKGIPVSGTMSLVARADGSIGLPGVDAETAYRWLTDLVIESERVIERYAAMHTAEIWFFVNRRDLACRLLENQESNTPAAATKSLAIDRTFASAVALFAAPGNTVLPDTPGPFEIPATEDLAVAMHVLRGLCNLHEDCLIQRRRLLLGGVPALGPQPYPVITLLPHLEDRLSIYTGRLEGGGTVFSRMGFHITALDRDEVIAHSNTRSLLWAAGRVASDESSEAASYRSASEVCPFDIAWYDGRTLLDALRLFEPAIVTHWGLSPLEIVAAAIACVWFWGEGMLDPRSQVAMRYTAQARAIFSVDEAVLVEHCCRRLPVVASALGDAIVPDRAAAVVERFLACFARGPGATTVSPSADRTIRLAIPTPFLFRAGDKFLIDLSLVLQAFSSIVNWLDVGGLQLKEKGRQFEDHVRSFLLSKDASLRALPEMERKFYDGTREVGEADVVVCADDTAFLIECKSHRARMTDRSTAYAEARNRMRPVVEWAHQVQSTAAYVAQHPIGRKHRVPEHVRWIVPIVCSPIVEVAWQDDAAMFLVREEVPITMTPKEVLHFIQSGRWRNRKETSQYPVWHYDALLAHGSELAGEGRLADAIAVFATATDVVPARASGWSALASALAVAGRCDEAIDAFRQSLAIEPTDAVVLENFGIALFEVGKYAEAIDTYRKLIQQNPRDARALVHLANALDASDDVDGAIDNYREALRLAPDHAGAYYNLGVTLNRIGDAGGALAAFRKAVELKPDYPAALNNLGQALANTGEYEAAIDACAKALALAPTFDDARHNLAVVLRQSGRMAEAGQMMGTLFARRGDDATAAKFFAAALFEDPDLPHASYQLGRALAAQGHRKEALAAFRSARKQHPDSWEVLRDLSIVLRETGQFDEAAARLSDACAHLPETTEARGSLAAEFNNLGIAFSNKGRRDQAVAHHEQAVGIYPDYPRGWYNLGVAYSRDGRNDEAIAAYRRAVDLAPDYAVAWSQLGIGLKISGRLGDSVRALRRALELTPDDPVTLGHLAVVHHRDGSFREAAALYQRAIAIMETTQGRDHPETAATRALYDQLVAAQNAQAGGASA